MFHVLTCSMSLQSEWTPLNLEDALRPRRRCTTSSQSSPVETLRFSLVMKAELITVVHADDCTPLGKETIRVDLVHVQTCGRECAPGIHHLGSRNATSTVGDFILPCSCMEGRSDCRNCHLPARSYLLYSHRKGSSVWLRDRL